MEDKDKSDYQIGVRGSVTATECLNDAIAYQLRSMRMSLYKWEDEKKLEKAHSKMEDTYQYWQDKFTDGLHMKAWRWFVNWDYRELDTIGHFYDYQKLAFWWDDNIEGRYLGEC